MKLVLALVGLALGTGLQAQAQTAPPSTVAQEFKTGVRHLSGGVSLSMNEGIEFRADEAEVTEATGEIALRGNVALRQSRRPAVVPVAATNAAGASFPEIPPVMFQVTSPVRLVIGQLHIAADSAEVNGLTGEMKLGGPVLVKRM